MKVIYPNQSQIDNLESLDPAIGPIHVIRLIKYREHADYSEYPNEDPCSGEEAYRRYTALLMPFFRKANALLITSSKVFHTHIAPNDQLWDVVTVMEWPNIGTFRDFISAQEYRALDYHRVAAVEDVRLLIAEPIVSPIVRT